MRYTAVLALAVPAIVAAMPHGGDRTATTSSIVKRQESETDELLFSVSLPTFISRRQAQDPPELDWSSDSCSSSPDNPFGFPFDPACQRHDFGYRNYKAQDRFTDANKLRIDDNFKDDLYYQCDGESAQGACEALANVYYEAVRRFGRSGADTDAADLASSTEYQQAVFEYIAQVQKAQDAGELPAQ